MKWRTTLFRYRGNERVCITATSIQLFHDLHFAADYGMLAAFALFNFTLISRPSIVQNEMQDMEESAVKNCIFVIQLIINHVTKT